ncbi:helix-turn-helix transcriptional regulator [Leptolyngbya sp. AN02str]|uniref:helix-turn-helix transcriptional regulator n=1 Tax=Leptolyngbya sp. AN02str TaxID=3423363 RepID=UPI003D31BABE
MVKRPELHPYSDRPSFDRLLLLIATLVQYPGVGSANPLESSDIHHVALKEVWERLQQVAENQGIALGLYTLATLKKDVQVLRQYGILHQRMYRWGYYLGTGAMQVEELRIALHALASQGQYQGDRQARQVYDTLKRRLKGLDPDGALFYPVRTQIDRAVMYTDPDEMMERQANRHTLFHELTRVEQAILSGQCLELHRYRDPHKTQGTGSMRIYPLQLIFSEIAWYLLYEHANNGLIEIERLDRFTDQCHPVAAKERGLTVQRDRLNVAHRLLSNGWGLYLGTAEAQRRELAGTLAATTVCVRFFPPVAAFILEAERRHPRQKVQVLTTEEGQCVDYQIDLPERSLNEFYRWICRFMQYARILEPPELVDRHQSAALKLLQQYQ